MIAPFPELYPWLEAAWKSLKSHIDTDRIPHALLMQGPAGLGKSTLAALFARRLLCTESGEMPCGHCHSCHLLEAGTHPDYRCLGPEEPGKVIKVDAIRKMISDLSLKPQYAGYRVFVIDQAEQMNLSSANALLKTLEEPARQTVLLLITHRPSRLPPTILSRCQKLSIRPPRKEVSIQWLQRQHPGCAAEVLLSAAGGSPLQALALTETDVVERRQRVFHEFGEVSRRQLDPLGIAERWHGQSHEDCLNWMLSWVSDMVRLLMSPAAPSLSNADLEAELAQLAKSHRPRNLIIFRDQLLDFRQALGGQVNRQLLLEEVLIAWSRLSHYST
jgi:DNA polymerase-3 subunit delta'